MANIEFISHDAFPEDEYTKELVYLCLDGKYRVAYVRKETKTGGLFWGVASIGVKRNGQKEFFPAFVQDSNFLERDIKDFLEKRKWEVSAKKVDTEKQDGNSWNAFGNNEKVQKISEVEILDEVPF